MYFKTADIAGLRLFYREAGDPSKPAIALLHGPPPRRTGSTTSFRVW
jgi:pimeloyl-ACP methyl ester carboxylesterase